MDDQILILILIKLNKSVIKMSTMTSRARGEKELFFITIYSKRKLDIIGEQTNKNKANKK